MNFWLQEAAAAAAAEAAAKTLAEISDRYGAPNLSRVEELDEPVLSDVSTPQEGLAKATFSRCGEPCACETRIAWQIGLLRHRKKTSSLIGADRTPPWPAALS